MTDEKLWDQLCAYMDLRGIDVLAVQETRCEALAEHQKFGFNYIHTPAKDGHHGCALITGPRVKLLTTDVLVEHRVVEATIRIVIGAQKNRLSMERHVIAAYLPQRDSDEQQPCIDAITQKATEDTIVLCDANGALEDMRNAMNMFSAAQLAGNEKWTWKLNGASSIIDHVLIHSTHKREVRTVSYEQPSTSDHRMLACVIKPMWTKKAEQQKEKPIQLHDLAYLYDARKSFSSQYKRTMTTSLTDIKKHIIEVPGEFYTRAIPSIPPWKTDKKVQKAVLRNRDAPNVLEWAEIDYATEHLQHYTEHLLKNPWTAWKHAHYLERQEAAVSGAVTAAQLRGQFKASMELLSAADAPPDFDVPDVPIHITEADFTLQELYDALETMKNHTACGPDGIPIEAFRSLPVAQDLLETLNSMLDRDTLPDELTHGTLTPIYKKKGSARDPVNYRPIVLLPVALKVLHKMILLRLRNAIDKHLVPCQAAYRVGHCTAMNMAVLQELAERSRTSNIPLYQVFTDFTAAFDSVHREHLFELLKRWNVPPRLLEFIKRSHAQQVLHVRFDGVTDNVEIKPTKGVMQGDTLAPYLFILVIDQILRKLPLEYGAVIHDRSTARTRETALRIPALAYADDVILLTNSLVHAQAALTIFEAAALKWGLKLNTKKGKTELLVTAHPSISPTLPQPRLFCVAGTVERTHTYKYLGWTVSDSAKNCWEDDFKKRVSHAWYMKRQYDRVWNSNAPTHVKKRLVQAVVLPSLTYAAITYPLTQTAIMKMQVATNKLLRACLGLRIEWSDPSIHTHTEELYSLYPFTPVNVVRSLLVQWGHWVRAANLTGSVHPVIHTMTSTFPHHKAKRGVHGAHPPSKWLTAAAGVDREALLTEPLMRVQWKSLSEKRTKQFAKDLCVGPVTSRRLEDGCSLPDWDVLIEKWFDTTRQRRKKEFF